MQGLFEGEIMRLRFAILLLCFTLQGCEPAAEYKSPGGASWTLVEHLPNHADSKRGIYKYYSEKEHVTFYATPVSGGWSITAIPGKR